MCIFHKISRFFFKKYKKFYKLKIKKIKEYFIIFRNIADYTYESISEKHTDSKNFPMDKLQKTPLF